jgi:mannan endo-1,4-beta-mannosidase
MGSIGAASGAMGAATRGLDDLRGIRDRRPFLKAAAIRVGLTVGVMGMLLIAFLSVIVAGPVIRSIADGKPIAIGEIGKVPSSSMLWNQPDWSYFMVWSEHLRGNNTNAEIQTAYFHPRVLNQGEVDLSSAEPDRSGPIVGLAGKCADVEGSGTANGTAIQLYTCSPGIAQTWTVMGDGTLRALGKCMDVAGAGTANGARVQLWDCNGTGAQTWVFDNAARTLRNPNSSKCLDVTGNNAADRTHLQIWDCHGNANQQWTLPV